MSNFCIGIGKCHRIYKYLLYNIIVKLVYEVLALILNEIKYEVARENDNSIKEEVYPEINRHVNIKSINIFCLFYLVYYS